MFQLSQDGSTALPMSQSDLPYRRAPRYLRLVNTIDKALDYAAGGFHVSLTRAAGGGCGDAATAISPTSKGASCVLPLNRGDLRDLWAKVASGYATAYSAQGGLGDMKALLEQANALADQAYGAENIEPPRDPVLVAQGVYASAEPVHRSRWKPILGLGLAFATIVGGAMYAGDREARGESLIPWSS